MRVTRLGLLLFVLLFPLFATAQTNVNEEQGLKPYDSWHGGELDHISLTNGGLVLTIPLASFPQRGNLDLSFFIRFSTKQWQAKTTCNGIYPHQTCTTKWQPIRGNSGAQVVSSADWLLQTIATSEPSFNQYVYSPDGNGHLLGGSDTSPTPLYPTRSFDATGLLNLDGVTLITPNGTRYAYGNSGNNTAAGRQPNSITDSNGNEITVSSSGWTDTLGRLIPGSLGLNGLVWAGVSTSDLSNCPSGTSSASIWNIPGIAGVNNGIRTFKFCFSTITLSTNFQQSGVTEYPATGTSLLTGVVLPDLTLWTFIYDNYGDVTSVGFPSGGSISYTYASRSVPNCSLTMTQVSRWVTSRTVNANDGSGGHTWNYAYTGTTTTVTSPLGDDAVHTITALQNACSLFETQAQYYQGSAGTGTLLKTAVTQFSSTQSPFTVSGDLPAVNVVPTQVTTTVGSKTSRSVSTYDSGVTNADGTVVLLGSLLQRDEYDFSNTLVRSTLNHYLWQDNATYKNANFIGLPVSTTIKNGSGTQIAQSTFAYDQVAVASSGVTQSLVAPPAGGNIRGNLTTSSHWLNTTNTFINSSAIYYDTGERASSTDPLNHTTTYGYSNTYAGAYVTGTCNALNQCVSGAYDFSTGLLTSFTDLNSNTFTYSYDNMLRLTQGNHPDGGWTKFFYPNPTTVERQRALTSTTHDDYFAVFDGLGRTIQTQQVTPGGTVLADTTYDANGRISTVSNPYFSGSNHQTDPTYGITTTQYDGLSRVLKTIKQDGNFSTVSYSDNCTVANDEANHQRKACVDALGRLVNVWEDPPGVNPNALNYETDYQYDTLGNLVRVDQKGSAPGDSTQWRTRTFTYDSLSRLLTTANPESGTLSYAYDAAGNLASKTDARNITVTYGYDQLNRLTLKTPSDGTPIVNFTYDQTSAWGYTLTNGIGRLTSEGIFPAWGQPYIQAALFNYDSMGRTLSERECLPSGCPSGSGLLISAGYDPLGNLTSLTYPDGQAVNYSYNSAGQALSAVTPNGPTYVSFADYWPSGAQYELYAPNLFHNVAFNTRLQPSSTYASNGGSGGLFSKAYNYGAQNNGNVLSITNNWDSSRSQTFTYDALNRLTHAENSGTNCAATLPDGHTEYWGNDYVYDAWGNLQHKNVTKCSAETLSVVALSNNRLSGYSYDASGNMLSDSFHSYQFNADGQMTSVDNGAATYQYNSSGERIRKNTAAGSTEYAYFGGNVIAEKNVSTAAWTNYIFFNGKRVARRDPSGAVHYYLGDHLGSTSMVVDANGNKENESEFCPFGGELQFSASADNHYKFTGKVRDAESGLDYFGARNYSSTLGRWISADWSAVPAPIPYANLEDPQTLNLYAYVQNNPLNRIDEDGHKRICPPTQTTTWNKNGSVTVSSGCMDDGSADPGFLGPFDLLLFGLRPTPARLAGEATVGMTARTFATTAAEAAAREAADAAADIAAKEAFETEVKDILTQATKTVGNQSVKASSRQVAEQAAKEWVGEGAKPLAERTTGAHVGLRSADGARIARYTSAGKPTPHINLVNTATGGNLHVSF